MRSSSRRGSPRPKRPSAGRTRWGRRREGPRRSSGRTVSACGTANSSSRCEVLAGYCTEVNVIIHIDSSVTVIDNGRGIPVDLHPTQNRPAVEVVMTTLHAGGKFDENSYKVSGGLHGVGVSVVNALSEWLEVEVRRGGKRYHQRYEHGEVKGDLETRGETAETGTTVVWKPDPTIFETVDYSFD